MELKLILKEMKTLVKTHDFKFEDVDFELNNTPDIAQTIVVTLVLGIG
jgi:3-phosphoshikimate 1-carboxyvinyltransferase